MRPFIAFIRKQPSAGFRVSFPDLPDCCISTGSTIDEARQNAESALALHCQLLQDTGHGVAVEFQLRLVHARLSLRSVRIARS